jgi:hypothetical protein
MHRFPSNDTVTERFERLKRYARSPKATDADKLPTLRDMEPRLLRLLARAKSPAPAVDGYPTRLGGDGRGGSELTSVEAAAEVLCFGEHSTFDPVSDLAEQGWGYLQDAVQALGALHGVLERADRLSSTTSRAEAGGAGTCLACGANVSGAAEDRLKRGLGPCCYSTWVRAGRPDMSVFKQSRKQAS